MSRLLLFAGFHRHYLLQHMQLVPIVVTAVVVSNVPAIRRTTAKIVLLLFT